MPKLIGWAVEAMSADLQNLLVFIMEKVNVLTTALDKCYVIKENEYGYYMTVEVPPESLEEANLEYYKDLLLLYRQYELFIRKVITEVGNIEENIPFIFSDFEDTLKELHDTVKFRTAVPVEDVFV